MNLGFLDSSSTLSAYSLCPSKQEFISRWLCLIPGTSTLNYRSDNGNPAFIISATAEVPRAKCLATWDLLSLCEPDGQIPGTKTACSGAWQRAGLEVKLARPGRTSGTPDSLNSTDAPASLPKMPVFSRSSVGRYLTFSLSSRPAVLSHKPPESPVKDGFPWFYPLGF